MKKFITKCICFALLVMSSLLIIPFIPISSGDSQYLVFAAVAKDSLLLHTPAPRIIFVGGSNLSFGLNSQLIKDSLQMNPINTGLNAGLGLEYMLQNINKYAQKGDVVIIVPEYDHFFDRNAYGDENLTRLLFDVSAIELKELNKQQYVRILKTMPAYLSGRLQRNKYPTDRAKYYSSSSFNQYGDASAYWADGKPMEVAPYWTFGKEINQTIVDRLKEVAESLENRGAKVFLSYPSFQASSFINCKQQISEVENSLKQTNIPILGTPQRYIMPDTLLYDTPYHLIKAGVDKRTELLIQDLRAYTSANR